ncbi:MAG: PP2C family protein-serine/threonine phosphatase [Myxococcota bacterium]
MGERRLRILVADDERLSRRLIVANLEQEFELVEAEDGQEAVELFEKTAPDAVLLDVQMPRMDGVEVTRAIKAMTGERFVPIFLISGLEEQSTLIRGLAAGADDFLPKPFNKRVFKPKLDVFLRLQEMQRRLVKQNEALEAFQRETRAEHAVAAQVFERMLCRGALTDPRVRVLLSPLSVFNGDTVLAATTPRGAFRLLLADVSGHGLTGALGTLPLMTLFHAATEAGESMRDCAMRLNAELKAMLPPQLFCGAVMLELDREAGRLDVLNAGMPPLLIPRNEMLAASSVNIPLGISRTWEPSIQTFEVEPDDRLFVMSDGVVEASNAAGEIFGLERVKETLLQTEPTTAFDVLIDAVKQHAGGQSDDLSLVKVRV